MYRSHILWKNILGIALLTLWCLSITVSAQEEDLCDPSLNPPPKDPWAYQLRDDRCEGVYIQGTSQVLRMVSLVESLDNYDLKSKQELRVEWTVPKSQRVTLQASSLQPRLYYRMDAVLPAGATHYRWPIDSLQALGISRGDLGVVGWARYSLDGNSRDVYLPLRIAQKEAPARSQNYRVILWPGRELEEVFVSLATITSDGSPDNFIWDGKTLQYGYYPAERGIAFEIPKPENAGIYYLEIGVTLSSGGVVTIEHWFYHAG